MNEAERFRAIYTAHFRSVLGFALRRTCRPEDAADIVAETFLVAWRRLDEVPEVEMRPWLFGVARNMLANQNRGELRRNRLAGRLGETLAQRPELSQREPADRGDDLGRAWQRVTEPDREILTLSAWEGLNATDIGVVLSMPSATVRTRLRRARGRFRQALEEEGEALPHRRDEPAIIQTRGVHDE